VHQHDVGVTPDFERALDVRDPEKRGRIMRKQACGVCERQVTLGEPLQQKPVEDFETGNAGRVLEHVRIGLAILRPTDMIRRNYRDVSRSEMVPKRFEFPSRSQRRIDLGLSAEAAHVVLFIECQIMNAGLDRRAMPLRAVSRGEFVAATYGTVDDVDGAAGAGAQFINLSSRESFGDRRTGHAVRGIGSVAARLDLGRESAHHLVILIVNAGDQTASTNGAEACVENMRRNSRKPFWMRAKGRKFERRRTGIDQFVNPCGPLVGVNCRVKCEIDARLRTRLVHLGREPFGRGYQAAIVVGHINDRSDSAGGGAASRPDEVFLTKLTAAMDLRIDRAGKHKGAVSAIDLTCRRGTGTHSLHPTVADQNISVLDDATG
jgi:hypothetical protein